MGEIKKLTKDDILKALSEIYDPEIPINIVDLGLIYKIDINNNNDVNVDMTFTTMGCPMHTVSYTHLDVYKRQSLSLMQLN